jgi:hypothetical protein
LPGDKDWGENLNDILEKIKKPPGNGEANETIEDEKNQCSNDGEGVRPAGYQWTSATQTSVTKEKFTYSRTLKFS